MTTEEKGIQAIIYLQKMAGKEETREAARDGWKKMSESQKDTTITVYKMFLGRKEAIAS